MKRVLLSVFLCLFSVLPSFAEDDLWGSYGNDIPNYGEQRFVGDDEFNAALEKIEGKSKINKWKRRLQGVPKGNAYSQGNEGSEISKGQGDKADLPVISLPVEIVIGDGILPVGHYQVKGEEVDGQIILNFYQAHELIAKIPAQKTEEDFNQEEILFANWESEDDNKIKLIYGSLDFNAYTVLNIK